MLILIFFKASTCSKTTSRDRERKRGIDGKIGREIERERARGREIEKEGERERERDFHAHSHIIVH